MTRDNAIGQVMETLKSTFPAAHLKSWTDSETGDTFVSVDEREIYYGTQYRETVALLETELLWPNAASGIFFVTSGPEEVDLQPETDHADELSEKIGALEQVVRALRVELAAVKTRMSFIEARLVQLQSLRGGTIFGNVPFAQGTAYLYDSGTLVGGVAAGASGRNAIGGGDADEGAKQQLLQAAGY